ncbi:peptide N-acetyl-beta-D-glucosaminyl asparaginase amidase A-domain-containing protein [Massariosphaeria phaeospora]|uniref:Peptide N-acetyl-beta-D-glucosaminyl asparaginase amidase A-domain-containing protein n=1 Tax=Massariosphaeria phaeospora TaxID=100035 RepID=A0A7C8MB63_9PLEO|nr:peptide N-acetyl-beta-D-glucosaminyl asparaginase amidase A-domain-containing protein [Massariosphaeria phaeospora]
MIPSIPGVNGVVFDGLTPSSGTALKVSPPVYSPEQSSCQQTLMVHTFGWSYGKPFVSRYNPPECKFNRVTFNFTVTSAGRQFDRLALMFFNDTEIFRTSTAEPTPHGIIWTYVKDMSNYVALFKESQKIIFDLGNLIDDTYTGSWNTTLTATFFTANDTIDAADMIIPISARNSASNNPSGFVVPDTKAMNPVVLPQNIRKAVFSIAACGQANEEFWWSNVLSSDTQAFGNETTLFGYSPFRELQLYIDGMLAGVAWPFPVIFTGGIAPAFWRPIVGIDAFDLREDEIDISPFLPILCDGKEHTFEIRVAGINDDGKSNGYLTGSVGSNWVITGKVFVWLDSTGSVTTGTTPTILSPAPSLDLNSTAQRINGTVHSLEYYVKVARTLSVESMIETSAGSRIVNWQQNITFNNEGHVTNGGNDQITKQTTLGSDVSSNQYSRRYEYPLRVSSSYQVLSGGKFTIDAEMGRGKYVNKIGELAFPSEVKVFDFSHAMDRSPSSFSGASTNTWQNGTSSYRSVPAQKKSYGSGSTEQYYSLSGIVANNAAPVQGGDNDPVASDSELYHRHVLAVNDSLVLDIETFGGKDVEIGFQNSYSAQNTHERSFAKFSIKALLGRGPF